jgi:hypothetical protein
MTREGVTAHCETTCQLHDGTVKLVEKHDLTLFGCDEDGGLVTTVNLIKGDTATIKKALYGLVGIVCFGVIAALLKLVILG